MNTTEMLSARPIALLGALLVVAGTGGMVVSFLFLASPHPLAVTAGSAGFVAGAILLAGGTVALAVLVRSPTTSEAVARAADCLWMFLPPGIAVLAWPVLYFTLFLGAYAFLPIVLLGCVVGAWMVSGRAAKGLWGLFGPVSAEPTRGALVVLRSAVFVAQLLAILASWPLFGALLAWLTSLGYKVGWS